MYITQYQTGEHQHAATEIQRIFRGSLLRSRLAHFDSEYSVHFAGKIQRAYRKRRRYLNNLETFYEILCHHATTIKIYYRYYRKRLAQWNKKELQRIERITILQSLFRRNKARHEYLIEHGIWYNYLATIITAGVRGYFGRKRAKRIQTRYRYYRHLFQGFYKDRITEMSDSSGSSNGHDSNSVCASQQQRGVARSAIVDNIDDDERWMLFTDILVQYIMTPSAGVMLLDKLTVLRQTHPTWQPALRFTLFILFRYWNEFGSLYVRIRLLYRIHNILTVRREDLLDEAMRLWLEVGLHNTSLSEADIARTHEIEYTVLQAYYAYQEHQSERSTSTTTVPRTRNYTVSRLKNKNSFSRSRVVLVNGKYSAIIGEGVCLEKELWRVYWLLCFQNNGRNQGRTENKKEGQFKLQESTKNANKVISMGWSIVSVFTHEQQHHQHHTSNTSVSSSIKMREDNICILQTLLSNIAEKSNMSLMGRYSSSEESGDKVTTDTANTSYSRYLGSIDVKAAQYDGPSIDDHITSRSSSVRSVTSVRSETSDIIRVKCVLVTPELLLIYHDNQSTYSATETSASSTSKRATSISTTDMRRSGSHDDDDNRRAKLANTMVIRPYCVLLSRHKQLFIEDYATNIQNDAADGENSDVAAHASVIMRHIQVNLCLLPVQACISNRTHVQYRLCLPAVERARTHLLESKRLQSAACVVQRMFRGFLARCVWIRLRRRQASLQAQIECLAREKTRLDSYRAVRARAAAKINSRVRGVRVRMTLLRLVHCAIVIQRAYKQALRRKQARDRARREVEGPLVQEVARRAVCVSGHSLTVVVSRCEGHYKVVGHDLIHAVVYEGFCYEHEVQTILDAHNQRTGERIRQYNYELVVKLLLSRLSIVVQSSGEGLYHGNKGEDRQQQQQEQGQMYDSSLRVWLSVPRRTVGAVAHMSHVERPLHDQSAVLVRYNNNTSRTTTNADAMNKKIRKQQQQQMMQMQQYQSPQHTPMNAGRQKSVI